MAVILCCKSWHDEFMEAFLFVTECCPGWVALGHGTVWVRSEL